MSKKWIVLTGLILFFYSHWIVFAETIYLKTGKKIRGQIIERNDKQIKVDISGVKITYYMDEIERIEDGATTTQKAQTSPANAPSLETPPTETLPSAETPSPQIFPSNPPTPPLSIDAPPDSDSKKTLILDLIEASGTKETMSQMFTQIIAQAPPDQVVSLKSVLDVNEIIPRLVPVYDKYFTEDELKELIAFYKGATGRKLIKVMPSIMEDSMKATESYFQEKMPAPDNQNK